GTVDEGSSRARPRAVGGARAGARDGVALRGAVSNGRGGRHDAARRPTPRVVPRAVHRGGGGCARSTARSRARSTPWSWWGVAPRAVLGAAADLVRTTARTPLGRGDLARLRDPCFRGNGLEFGEVV